MRVIGGKAKGRKLLSPRSKDIRPILDRIKTVLFDILRSEIEGKDVLDLFAGTGAIGIEALSQGAAFCTFIDSSSEAIGIVKENLKATGLTAQAKVLRKDAFYFLRHTDKQFDIIFIAPPQYKNLWLDALYFISERPQVVKEGGLLVVQIDPREYEEVHLVH
ncbi:MAG: 16S rRNA (guanine(966)-N(2))-methyltransferase RsmD, partial [Candidatus Dadabacteria bacterium]